MLDSCSEKELDRIGEWFRLFTRMKHYQKLHLKCSERDIYKGLLINLTYMDIITLRYYTPGFIETEKGEVDVLHIEGYRLDE